MSRLPESYRGAGAFAEIADFQNRVARRINNFKVFGGGRIDIQEGGIVLYIDPSAAADTLPWAIASTNTTTPTVTTGDGYFVTHYDGGTRMDKLTGESPTITGTGVLVAELTVDASTSAGTWTTAWKFITDAGITDLATAYSAMTAAGKSDATHIRVPVWFVERSGSAAPYTLTTTRMWFGHIENTMWRPPFA